MCEWLGAENENKNKDGPASSRVSRAETRAGTKVARSGNIQRVVRTIFAQVGHRREYRSRRPRSLALCFIARCFRVKVRSLG